MQDKRNEGEKRCRIRKNEGEEGCRIREMKERRDAG